MNQREDLMEWLHVIGIVAMLAAVALLVAFTFDRLVR